MSSLHLILRPLKRWSLLIAVVIGLHVPLWRLQAQSWYNTAWTNRKPITIDHTKVSGSSSLSSFPVLISVTDANLASTAQSSGNDILFTASDGVTKLNHEIESYTASSGSLIAWVQVPALSPTADTVIYVYYGNPSAANQQNATAVWDSNYKGVWHLGNGATQTLTDSTSNGNSLTAGGTSAAAGKIGGASSNPGTVPNGLLVTSPSGLYNLSSFTYSTWVNPAALTNTAGNATIELVQDGAKDFNFTASSGTLTASIATNGSYRLSTSSGALSASAWQYVVATYVSGGAPKIYLNGTEVSYTSQSAGGGSDNTDSGGVGLGVAGTNNYYGSLNGSVDETRISSTNRSGDWIKTEYNNQNAPSTFYSVGGQQNSGGGGGGTVTITMATSPSGLALTVDGGGCTAPCNYQWTQGSSHSIAASSPQNGAGGTQYLFASWSDGGAQSHSITASASATYTATFTPVSGGANLITNYSYDLYDNLTQVSMPRAAGTQTRTFVYNGKYLISATNPENGTVTYTYTANQKIASKTDAKGQKIVYTYDAYLRLTEIQRYPTPGNEDVCQRTLFYYDTNPFDGSFSQYAFGRPTATQYGAPAAGGVCNGVPYTLSDQYSYTSGGLVTKKRLAVSAHLGNPLTTVNLDTSQTYDNQGRVVTVSYPNSGPTYTYGYDTMDRPISLTDNQSVTWVNNVQYGLSSELLQIAYAGYGESRTYNSRLQLTSVGSMQYTYSATQNNGQIVKQNDLASGEEVTYTYDSLQRLIGAVTTDSSWGQAFTYDGFGNRTSAAVTKGHAPYGNWIYDPVTNRMGGYNYDANGNMLSVPGVSYGAVSYDVENRLVSVPTGSNPEQYAYTPGNQRVWRRKPDGTEELYFYGISGQKLGTYTPFIYNNGSFVISTLDTNLYFGSRTIVSRGVTVQPDRLGSNRAGGSRYFPYGEEQQVTAQDRDKYATYYRDGTTGLDYAQNRYYASTLARFLTPDQYKANNGGPGDATDPQSWNRYAYAGSDPVNFNDPTGSVKCRVVGWTQDDSGTVADVQCTTGLGTIVDQQTYINGDPNKRTVRDKYADAAEKTWGRDIEQAEIHEQIDPIAALARTAFGYQDCANLFSGKNVISPTAALDSLYTNIQISFGPTFNLIGGPQDAQTSGVGLLPSISLNPPGTYYKTVQTTFNATLWPIWDTRQRLLTFIHELGHAISFMSVGTITGGFVQNDRDPTTNANNDSMIAQKCVNALFN